MFLFRCLIFLKNISSKLSNYAINTLYIISTGAHDIIRINVLMVSSYSHFLFKKSFMCFKSVMDIWLKGAH